MVRSRRSEEHTSELQSQSNLVCRLLLEKKKKKQPCSQPTHLDISSSITRPPHLARHPLPPSCHRRPSHFSSAQGKQVPHFYTPTHVALGMMAWNCRSSAAA